MHFVESTNFILQERQETHQKEADQEERRTTRQTNQGDYLKIVNKNNYYFKVRDDVFFTYSYFSHNLYSASVIISNEKNILRTYCN